MSTQSVEGGTLLVEETAKGPVRLVQRKQELEIERYVGKIDHWYLNFPFLT